MAELALTLQTLLEPRRMNRDGQLAVGDQPIGNSHGGVGTDPALGGDGQVFVAVLISALMNASTSCQRWVSHVASYPLPQYPRRIGHGPPHPRHGELGSTRSSSKSSPWPRHS
jgi:hypothetical protein